MNDFRSQWYVQAGLFVAVLGCAVLTVVEFHPFWFDSTVNQIAMHRWIPRTPQTASLIWQLQLLRISMILINQVPIFVVLPFTLVAYLGYSIDVFMTGLPKAKTQFLLKQRIITRIAERVFEFATIVREAELVMLKKEYKKHSQTDECDARSVLKRVVSKIELTDTAWRHL